METRVDQPPLIVIVGETASGKSALALEVARRFNGEIIAADSRTVYRGMDIGTAKPSAEEQKEIHHHLLDITMPDKPITVADFKKLANKAIKDISGRGKLPILVGGTGLYVDSVLYDFQFRSPADPAERQQLQNLSVEELQNMLKEQGIPPPTNERNPRHLIRQLETGGATAGCAAKIRNNSLIIGLQIDREQLKTRITRRVDTMLDEGLEEEVKQLVNRYGWGISPLQTIGYQEFRPYFEGRQTLEEVRQEIVQATQNYAKRQRTWFKRNKHIHWICKSDEVVDLVTTFLNK